VDTIHHNQSAGETLHIYPSMNPSIHLSIHPSIHLQVSVYPSQHGNKGPRHPLVLQLGQLVPTKFACCSMGIKTKALVNKENLQHYHSGPVNRTLENKTKMIVFTLLLGLRPSATGKCNSTIARFKR